MIPIVGRLYGERNVGISIYGRAPHSRSVANIMNPHHFLHQGTCNELYDFETHRVLTALAKLDISHAHIDLGKLTVKYMEQQEQLGDKAPSVQDFVAAQLSYLVGVKSKPIEKSQDIVLYGFGRIGRLIARLLV